MIQELQIDTRSQFHQHFTHTFLIRKQIVQLFSSKFGFVIFGTKISNKKCADKTLMKLTPVDDLKRAKQAANSKQFLIKALR
jgi:hypothetical protein